MDANQIKDGIEIKKGIEYYWHKNYLIGIRLHGDHRWDQMRFLTADDLPMQLGLLYYDDETEHIRPHAHHKIRRAIEYTAEVLVCIEGKMNFHFYDPAKEWEVLFSLIIKKGDVLCIYTGAGHGGAPIEPTRLIEIKQGPYFGMKEKFFFPDKS